MTRHSRPPSARGARRSAGLGVAAGLMLLAAGAVLAPALRAANPQDAKPALYVIGTAHLDSQWNWTVQDTIRQYVAPTFLDNFKLFERFPRYVFNYEGAIHYMWFKEYYPDAWPLLQKYVADGRWRLSGSWINAADVNVPSPESLMRQALYGKRFFRREFNRVSQDVYLPDCFGFGFALPSIAAHSGLSAFSTQKLTWGSSVPIPFPIGRWKGVDGNDVVAALNPRDYVTRIRSDISTDPKWSDDLTSLGNSRQVGFRYFGTGDIGEAPDAESVDWLEKAMANRDGRVEVRSTSADQLARDLTPAERAALPEYTGELTMKTHGVGCYTSQAAMKRFNRMNELLADAAERAAVAAEWLAGAPYPGDRLREAWVRVLWHQFHDDLTGTSIPQAYGFSWNDELVSANQFAAVLERATGDVAGVLDTRSEGIPLVVYNPLSTARRDAVEASVRFPGAAPASVRVIDRSTGQSVPAQVLGVAGSQARILFLAEMPSVGYKVYEVRAGVSPAAPAGLKVTQTMLENARYRVGVDANGDVASSVDKDTRREMLRAPVRLEMRDDPSPDKPAWRILWNTVNAAPREYLTAPTIRIVERGPVRVALEITRKAAGSTIVQRVSLLEGGDRVDVENLIDWKSPNTLLKASFPFAASNPKATYDLGLGTIERGNNTPDHYEVPAQKWADVTDAGGAFGAAVLNDGKYGWDKPADNVLRLTLLHTPLPRASAYQRSQDLGSHRFTYSIAGHAGDWRAGHIPARAAALNQPLMAFQTTSHAGRLGPSFSLLSLDAPNGQVAIAALKKAEDSDELVVRLQERHGRPARARIRFAGAVAAVREINAAEEEVGAFPLSPAELAVDLKAYQPRTLAVRLRPSAALEPARPAAVPLDLPFNLDGVSRDDNRADGDFDGKKQTLAGELLPKELQLDGVPFMFGSNTAGALNVVVPNGQSIALPPGLNRVYVIAAAVGGDVPARFQIVARAGARPAAVDVVVREWEGPVGRWFTPLRDTHLFREVYVPPMRGQSWTQEAIQSDLVVGVDSATGVVQGIDQIRPGFVKRDEIAWVGAHRHAPGGNQPYIPSYVFAYAMDLPAGARALQLPNDGRLRILAITAAPQPARLRAAGLLYAPELPAPDASVQAKAGAAR
jgi:alpha-mannosidase